MRYKNMKIALLVTVAVTVLSIVAMSLSMVSNAAVKEELVNAQDTNQLWQTKYDKLKENLGVTVIDEPSTDKKDQDEPVSKEEPTAGATVKVQTDFSGVDGVVSKFISAYYTASHLRTPQELMQALNPFLTAAGQKKYAPQESSASVSKEKYQSRANIEATYFKQFSETKVKSMSACTQETTLTSGASKTTVLFKTECVLENGTWKVDTFAIVVTDAFPAEKLA